jgi:hemerythrin-like metal-binding protein
MNKSRKATINEEEADKVYLVYREFLSRMNNEIHPSLSTISSMLDKAEDTKDQEKAHDFIVKANNTAKRLLAHINNLIDLSKFETNNFELSFHDFNLEEMLSTISNMINLRVQSKNQKLFINLDHDIPVYIYGDELRLTQVIMNLLTNAVKYSAENKKIIFNIQKMEETGGVITLKMEVADTGIGISGDQQHKLFSPFKETNDNISQKLNGSGISLAVSKKIVEMMDGKIRIESELGKGATFIFTIKVKKGNEKNAINKQKIVIHNTFDFSGKTILAVDDNEINREVLAAVLEKTNVKMDFAENGKIAFSMFKENQDKYNLILMDVHMPVMNGFESTREIRTLNTAQSEGIPIIAMTASVFKEEISRCLASGMNDHVGKPIDPDILYMTIKKHIFWRNNTVIRKVDTGIKWDDSLLLGDEQIDTRHREIFELVNTLVRSNDEGPNITKLKNTLDFLVNFSAHHFDDEEALQIKHGFPEYEKHKKLHDEFKITVTSLVQRFTESGSSPELSNDVTKTILKWLVNHIMYEDKKISAHIRNITD